MMPKKSEIYGYIDKFASEPEVSSSYQVSYVNITVGGLEYVNKTINKQKYVFRSSEFGVEDMQCNAG